MHRLKKRRLSDSVLVRCSFKSIQFKKYTTKIVVLAMFSLSLSNGKAVEVYEA